MNLTDYQKFTRTTAIYPAEHAIVYCALGLVNEAGEVAGKIKKVIRDKDGKFESAEVLETIAAEVGDVFWYAVRLLDELGINSELVIQDNMEKLQSRKDRNVLQGSGDNR